MSAVGRGLLLGLVAIAFARAAVAGEADVLDVQARCTTIRTCDFDVRVRHSDVGFSHYADRYEIVAPSGEVLGTRVLQHPHVHEQPFVRSLVGIEIPDGTHEVTVRAHDNVHGDGGAVVTVQLVFPSKPSRPSTPKNAPAGPSDAPPEPPNAPAQPAGSVAPGEAATPSPRASTPTTDYAPTADAPIAD